MKNHNRLPFLSIILTTAFLLSCPTAAQPQDKTPAAAAKSKPADSDPGDSKSAETAPVARKLPSIAQLRSARATLKEFLKRIKATKYPAAVQCMELAGKDSEEARELAWKLKNILERIPDLELDRLSDEANAPQQTIPTGIADSPIVIATNDKGVWRFTAATVERIEELHEHFADLAPVAGRDWLRDLFPTRMTTTKFLLPTYQWICLFITIFAGIIFDYISRFVLQQLTLSWLKFRKIDSKDEAASGLWKPVGLLIRGTVWYGGTCLLDLPPKLQSILLIAICFFAIVVGVWTAFLLIDLLGKFLAAKAKKTDTRFDDLLIPLVTRSLKAFAVCIGIVSFAETFDFSIAGLLGGMGIGGVALAFAAKDTVANVFGSITVLADRPFEIGDWIVTDKVEGSVETVGIRSTRVRTFYNSLVTVPNHILTTAVLDNMGRRRYRRIKTYLALQYDTPTERIEAFCEGIRELLRRHAYTRKDYYHVYLNRFSDSSLDVLLYCFLECPDWSVELRERHRLFIDIIKLAKRLGVSFAFPTQTLHMFQEEAAAVSEEMTHEPMSKPIFTGRRLAAEIAGPLLPPGKRPGGVDFAGPSEIGSEGDKSE